MTPSEKRLLIQIGRALGNIPFGYSEELALARIACEIELQNTPGVRLAPVSPSGQHDENCSCAFCR